VLNSNRPVDQGRFTLERLAGVSSCDGFSLHPLSADELSEWSGENGVVMKAVI
jgi:hypothetical protein